MISDAQERRLSLRDKLKLRLHLHWCVACARYQRQVGFLRKALRRYGR
jgi:hypothetical protein